MSVPELAGATPDALDLAGLANAAAAEAESRRYGVTVSGQHLLLAADGAVRVLEPPPAYRMPNTRAWFLGVSNVRGSLVPVYDLGAWLGLPAPEGRRMLLVVGDGDAGAGVLVDTAPRHLLIPTDLPPVDATAVPPGLSGYAREAFTIADTTWTAVNWDGLFDDLKTLALAAD